MKYIKMFESFMSGGANSLKKIETAINKKQNIIVVTPKIGEGVMSNIRDCFDNLDVDYIQWTDYTHRNKNPKSGEYAIIYYDGLYDDLLDNLVQDIQDGMLVVIVTDDEKGEKSVDGSIRARSIVVNM
jgi:hypothetical protein